MLDKEGGATSSASHPMALATGSTGATSGGKVAPTSDRGGWDDNDHEDKASSRAASLADSSSNMEVQHCSQ